MRPPSPDPTGPGQESVWDYPRPPRLEHVDRRIVVEFAGEVIVDARDVVRVLETSHPPVYYLPIDAFVPGVLRRGEGASFCEFKGRAAYFDVPVNGRVAPRVGWTYPEPSRGFEDLVGRVALYPAPMDRCTVDGELVTPQPGTFYGGWVTSEIRGPFKGVPGSAGW